LQVVVQGSRDSASYAGRIVIFVRMGKSVVTAAAISIFVIEERI
jgi:hypothetical protein